MLKKCRIVLFFSVLALHGIIGQTCYTSVRNYSGVESFVNEALIFQSCAIQNTVKAAMTNPSNEFKVFGYDYYPILGYATEQPNEIFYKQDLDTLYSKPAFIAIFRFFVGSQIRYKIHMKLPSPLTVTLNASQIFYLENYLKKKLEGIVPDENGYRKGEIDALSAFNNELGKYLSGNSTVPTDLSDWDRLEMPTGIKVIVENGTPIANARIDETNNIIKFLNGSNKEPLSGDLLNNDDTFKLGSYDFDIFYSVRTSLDNTGFNNPIADSRSYVNIYAQKQDTSPYYDLYIKITSEIDNQTANLIFDELYDEKLREYGYSLSDDDPNGNLPTLQQLENRERQSESLFPIGKKYMQALSSPMPYTALACGALDGLLGNIEVLFEIGKFAVTANAKIYARISNYMKEATRAAAKGELFKKLSEDAGHTWQNFKTNVTRAYDMISNANIGNFIKSIGENIDKYFTGLAGQDNTAYYGIGQLVFEVALLVATGGAGAVLKAGANVAKTASKVVNKIDDIGSFFSNVAQATSRGGVAAKKWDRCQILGIGCFVKDTKVLIASNTLRNNTAAFALAALPIVYVPIQDIQLFDYALAHKTVNLAHGLTASIEDTYIKSKDPFTSDQQRSRDLYEINDTDWNEVTFEQVLGSSKCKLALHNDWITNSNYALDAIVTMNLPEQGISGPFKITSIKHITPQKKPVDEDKADNYEFRPVTGLFVHKSNDVWKIKFDNGTELGVTNNHPIFSVSKGDWQHAGHLEIGEEVLAKCGNTKIVGKERDYTVQPVYNLEVKDLHNFLTGDFGVVVHNNCITTLFNLHIGLFKNADDVVHILRGNIKNGNAGGVHHISAITQGTAKEIGERIVGPNGLYKVKVGVKDANGNFIAKTANDGYSTFFPESWDQIRVMDEINHAVKVSSRNFVQGNEYWGYAKDGLTKIHYYLRTDGTIISAFPNF